MARRTRNRRTRRKSTMRSTLERSLRKTIERSIRKSLKKLTNRKTKKKKRKTKRKKKLQRGGEGGRGGVGKINRTDWSRMGENAAGKYMYRFMDGEKAPDQDVIPPGALASEIKDGFWNQVQNTGTSKVWHNPKTGEYSPQDYVPPAAPVVAAPVAALEPAAAAEPAVALEPEAAAGGPVAAPLPQQPHNLAYYIDRLIGFFSRDKRVFLRSGDGEGDIQEKMNLGEVMDKLRSAGHKEGEEPDEGILIGIYQTKDQGDQGDDRFMYDPVSIKQLYVKVRDFFAKNEPAYAPPGPPPPPIQEEAPLEPELEPETGGAPLLLFDPEAGLASPVAEEDDEDQAAAAAKIQAAERGRQGRQAYTQKRAAATTIQSAARMRLAQEQQRLLAEQQRAAIAQQQQEQAQQQAAQEPPPAVPPPAVPPPPAPEPPPAPAGVGVVAAGSNCKEIQENITILQRKIKTLEDDKRRLQEAIGARTGAGDARTGAGDAGSAAALVASQQELERVQQSLAQVQAELDECIKQKDFLMNELKKLIKELYCSILTKVRISRLVKTTTPAPLLSNMLPEPLRRDIGLGEYNALTYEVVLHALLSDNLLYMDLNRGLPGPPILTRDERNEILQAEGLVPIPPGAQEMVGRVRGSLLNHIRLSRLGPVA